MNRFQPMDLETFKETVFSHLEQHGYKKKSNFFGSEQEYYDVYDWILSRDTMIENGINEIEFDFENHDFGIQHDDAYNFTELMGFQMLDSMPFIGMYAGGDWEHPVFFIVYYDGENFRGYIPKMGNTYNPVTKAAFGNNDQEDEKYLKAHFPEIEVSYGEFYLDGDYFNFDNEVWNPEHVKQDLRLNFYPADTVQSTPEPTYKQNMTVQEMEVFDELIEWAEELRQETADAVSFWNDYAPDPEADHPSNHLFHKWNTRTDFDDVLENAKRIIDSKKVS